MMSLRRYWFEFGHSLSDRPPPGTLLGCGVTAYDDADAAKLIEERVFGQGRMPAVVRMTRDVDVSTLDRGHVQTSMGNVFVRGIWFPLGYQN